ncbi:MAG: hypothetical protein BMS9Abin28_0313 [Anaerolineae bacterium]|nr:MAG: hypothetical protein BMS9Abin28_0313 [Anaerolineae bacterium]
MDILILLVAMLGVGLVIGYLAGKIWKDERPYGLSGDIGIAAVTTVIVGLIDWFVIPAMGFSQTVVLLGLLTEPALAALLVLWLVRRARR